MGMIVLSENVSLDGVIEDPAGGEIFREQGQLGEGESEQVMELVDQARALADDGLEPAGDLAEDAKLQ